MWRWRKEIESGQYYDLLNRGFIKPEDQEPDTTGFEFYHDAFKELSTARPVGMSVGSIPFTAIAEYFTIYDIDGDFHEFASIIRHMDRVYLELEAGRAKKSKEGKDSSATNLGNKKNNSKS